MDRATGGARRAQSVHSTSHPATLLAKTDGNETEPGQRIDPYEIVQQFRDLTPEEQDARAVDDTIAALDVGDSITFNSRSAARSAFMEGSDLRTAANRFFKGATGKSEQFRIVRYGDDYEFSFFSPANNPGYGKRYIEDVNPDCTRVNSYKVTEFQSEALEIKWIERHGTLVQGDDA
jgi:hypothetical protein